MFYFDNLRNYVPVNGLERGEPEIDLVKNIPTEFEWVTKVKTRYIKI